MASDAMTDTFRHYLEHCSEDMANQIVAALRQAGDRVVPNVTYSMAVSGSAVSKSQKKQRRKAKSDVETGGPKRPLNSWMAYRKFYNRVLQGYTQKAISKCLTQMWKADPFTAKWALLAKAYSVVRGSGEKKDAPLDEFFEICAEAVGVIPPDFYMGALGWSLLPPVVGDSENVPQLVRDREPSIDEFDSKFTMTNLGVDELVKMCSDSGYGQPTNSRSSAHGSLTMASRPTVAATDDLLEVADMPPLALPDTTDAMFATNEVGPNNNEGAEHQHQVMQGEDSLAMLGYESPTITLAHAAGQETLEQAIGHLEQMPGPFPHFIAELPESLQPDAADQDSWDAFTVDPFQDNFDVNGIDFDAYLNM